MGNPHTPYAQSTPHTQRRRGRKNIAWEPGYIGGPSEYEKFTEALSVLRKRQSSKIQKEQMLRDAEGNARIRTSMEALFGKKDLIDILRDISKRTSMELIRMDVGLARSNMPLICVALERLFFDMSAKEKEWMNRNATPDVLNRLGLAEMAKILSEELTPEDLGEIDRIRRARGVPPLVETMEMLFSEVMPVERLMLHLNNITAERAFILMKKSGKKVDTPIYMKMVEWGEEPKGWGDVPKAAKT